MAASDRQTVRAVMVTVGTLVALYLIYQIRSTLGSLFVATFLAVALAPAVSRVERIVKHRLAAILVVLVGGGIILTGVGLLVVPPIVDGIDTIATEAPTWTEQLQNSRTYERLDTRYDLTARINDAAAALPTRAGDAVAIARSIALGAVGAMFGVIVILVMSVFLLVDGGRIVRWIIDHSPSARRARLDEMAADIYHAVGGYVAGSLSIAFVNGVLSYAVMSLLGIPLAATLAVVMGFLGLIPLVGASLGGALIAGVALTANFPTAVIAWVVYFLVYQQVENNLLQPFVYRRTVALHPLLVLLAVLIGSSQLGILGALFAIPIAATVQIAARDWWMHRSPDEEEDLLPLTPAPHEVADRVVAAERRAGDAERKAEDAEHKAHDAERKADGAERRAEEAVETAVEANEGTRTAEAARAEDVLGSEGRLDPPEARPDGPPRDADR